MEKKIRVKKSLLRKNVDRIPIFISATPQFICRAIPSGTLGPSPIQVWQYCNHLNLDIIQVGHPSFYPVKVLELPEGALYKDKMGRSHIIAGYYDNFCAPFPLLPTKKLDLATLKEKWESYLFPDPLDPEWFSALDTIKNENESIDDPLSIWGVINGPFEPTWQLLSDGWPQFFILYRRDPDLAKEIINKVTDYCIEAGRGMIDHGADAIRIGDDYALNEGLMTSKKVWKELIYPVHKRLVRGLKEKGGDDFPIILHSDGNIMEMLNLLGEGGMDGLNPIQPDALDFKTVINAIGHKLSMTGAFDLRLFLKSPSPQTFSKLESEINRLFSIIEEYNQVHENPTGFCIGPTHQIQPESHLKTFEKWVELVQKRNLSYESK